MRSRVLVILAFCTVVPALSVTGALAHPDGVFAAVSSGPDDKDAQQPDRSGSSTSVSVRVLPATPAPHTPTPVPTPHPDSDTYPDTYPDSDSDLLRLFRVRQLKLRERPVRWIGLDGLRIRRFVLGRLRTRRSLLRELRDRRGSRPAVHRCRRPAVDDPGPDRGGSRPVRCRPGLAVHPAPPLPRQGLTLSTSSPVHPVSRRRGRRGRQAQPSPCAPPPPPVHTASRRHGVTAQPSPRRMDRPRCPPPAGRRRRCRTDRTAPLDEGDGHLHDVRVDVRGQ